MIRLFLKDKLLPCTLSDLILCIFETTINDKDNERSFFTKIYDLIALEEQICKFSHILLLWEELK